MEHRPERELSPAAPALGGAAPAAFADDDGSVPAALVALLEAWAAGERGIGAVVAGLAGHRLLVPLLEVDADLLEGDDADPCAGQDRAVAAVSLRGEDGAVGIAFTGMAPLLAWNATARPMPVEATRVAAALLAEGGVALLVDPAGPHPLRVAGAALARLATGEAWPRPWQDPAVRDAVARQLDPALRSGELAVRLAEPGPDLAADLLVEVRFPGVPDDEAVRRGSLVAERLSASAVLREVFDGVLAVRPI